MRFSENVRLRGDFAGIPLAASRQCRNSEITSAPVMPNVTTSDLAILPPLSSRAERRRKGGRSAVGMTHFWNLSAVLCALIFCSGSLATEKEASAVPVGQMNCTACHAASAEQAAWLLPKAAPSLAGLEKRVGADWLRKWLAAPHETMPGAMMPDLLHGLPAAERATAADELTHFLLSSGKPEFRLVPPDRAAVARGEISYHRIGCVACHQPQKGAPDSVPSAPLPKMVEKWSFDGLREFLLKPHESRPSGRMPGLHLTDAEAFDLAHFLLRETRMFSPLEATVWHERVRSLAELDTTTPASTTPVKSFSLEVPGVNRRVNIRFAGWLRVDTAGDYTFYLTAEGATRIALDGKWVEDEDCWERESTKIKTVQRLDSGWHELKVDFVRRGGNEPKLAVEWEGPGVKRGAIPAERLRAERNLEPAPEPAAFVVDRAKAEKGRARFAELNCAACHEAKAPAPGVPALAALDATRGCLAENAGSKVPDFHFTSAQRTELRASLALLNRADLAAPTPAQRVAHTMASFNCYACHARDGVGGVPRERDGYFTSSADDLGDEGRIPPKLDGVGDKLRPDWLAKVLAEGAGVRPYLNTRMPQFGGVQVKPLAGLFVALDRHAQPIKPASDTREALLEAGRKLTGTDGLSCIGCHRFNKQPAHALQVMDLITTPGRLSEDWFRQFLRDPNRFHPGTRMPALWPGGRSAFPDLLGGDPDRQFAALWAYFAEGERAKFPEGLSRKSMELVVGGETVVYRGKLWEAGFRAIATGYPGGLNAAFDAEEMRLALLWRGRFLDASPHWSVQGMAAIRPLGTEVVVFPHGPALAVLAEAHAPWPSESSKAAGMKFRGTQLDAQNRPTLLYSFRDVGVEDFIAPAETQTALHRTLKFTGQPPDGLHFRVAVGRLAAAGENTWRIEGALTLRVAGAFLRGKGDKQELLVPVPRGGKQTLEISYETTSRN